MKDEVTARKKELRSSDLAPAKSPAVVLSNEGGSPHPSDLAPAKSSGVAPRATRGTKTDSTSTPDDATPHQGTARKRDLIIGYTGGLERYGYPKDRLIEMSMIVNPNIFKPRILTDEQKARYGCDIMFASNRSEPTDQIVRDFLVPEFAGLRPVKRDNPPIPQICANEEQSKELTTENTEARSREDQQKSVPGISAGQAAQNPRHVSSGGVQSNPKQFSSSSSAETTAVGILPVAVPPQRQNDDSSPPALSSSPCLRELRGESSGFDLPLLMLIHDHLWALYRDGGTVTSFGVLEKELRQVPGFAEAYDALSDDDRDHVLQTLFWRLNDAIYRQIVLEWIVEYIEGHAASGKRQAGEAESNQSSVSSNQTGEEKRTADITDSTDKKLPSSASSAISAVSDSASSSETQFAVGILGTAVPPQPQNDNSISSPISRPLAYFAGNSSSPCLRGESSSSFRAPRSALRLHLYGLGWENHPRFAKYARGPLDHGEELSIAYQAARYCLHLNCMEAQHQRSVEVIAAGSRLLSRFTTRQPPCSMGMPLHAAMFETAFNTAVASIKAGISEANLPLIVLNSLRRQWPGKTASELLAATDLATFKDRGDLVALLDSLASSAKSTGETPTLPAAVSTLLAHYVAQSAAQVPVIVRRFLAESQKPEAGTKESEGQVGRGRCTCRPQPGDGHERAQRTQREEAGKSFTEANEVNKERKEQTPVGILGAAPKDPNSTSLPSLSSVNSESPVSAISAVNASAVIRIPPEERPARHPPSALSSSVQSVPSVVSSNSASESSGVAASAKTEALSTQHPVLSTPSDFDLFASSISSDAIAAAVLIRKATPADIESAVEKTLNAFIMVKYPADPARLRLARAIREIHPAMSLASLTQAIDPSQIQAESDQAILFDLFLKQGQLDQAEAVVRQLYARPGNKLRDGLSRMAGELNKAGYKERVLDLLREDHRLGRQTPGWTLHLVNWLLDAKDFDEAATIAGTLNQRLFPAPAGIFHYAQTIARLGHHKDAIDLIRHAYLKDTRLRDGLSRVAWLLQGVGKTDQSLMLLAEDHDAGRQTPPWTINYITALLEKSHLNVADAIVDNLPESEISDELKPRYLNVLIQLGRLDKAEHLVRRLYTNQSSFLKDGFSRIAGELNKKGKKHRVLALLKEDYTSGRQTPDWTVYLIAWLLNAGELREAKRIHEHLNFDMLIQAPSQLTYLVNMALMGDTDQSKAIGASLYKGEPNKRDILSRIGWELFLHGLSSQALIFLEEDHRLAHQSSEWTLNYVRVLSNTHNRCKALSVLDSVCFLSLPHDKAKNDYISLLFELEQTEEIERIVQTLPLDTVSTEVRTRIAMTQYCGH